MSTAMSENGLGFRETAPHISWRAAMDDATISIDRRVLSGHDYMRLKLSTQLGLETVSRNQTAAD